jgi:FK506-binding nuclear protein
LNISLSSNFFFKDDSDDAEEADSDEEVQEPKTKVQKLNDKKDSKAKQNGVANGKEQSKEAKKAAQPTTPAPEKGQKRTLAGGVIVEELRVGTGLEAKNGKKVQVYYEGRLKTNNKVFDSTKNGPGFKFALGRGGVIKGWDLGVAGMKVGGKRRITCPPAAAYGAKGSPPVIPPNATLVFDVELKNVL